MRAKTRKLIEKYAKSLAWTPRDFYWKHTLQVRGFALLLQDKVGGDRDVVETAAIFHDTGKAESLTPGHEEISAGLAKQYLEKIEFDKRKIKKVAECIRYKSFRLIEAKILRSADSMSLIMDKSGGKEWFFKNVLRGNRKRILNELRKSYSEIEFKFAREFVEKTLRNLLGKYKATR